MTMELKKEQVNLRELTYSQTSSVLVDGDIIVPDVKPDIKEILLAEATAVVTGSEIAGERLNVSGHISVHILYVPETDNEFSAKLKSMTAKFDFTDRLECPVQGVASVSAKTEHIEFSVLNSRKLNVKVGVGICAKVYTDKELMLPTGAPDGVNIEMKMKPVSLYNVICDRVYDVLVSESVEVPAAKPEIDEILKVDIRAVRGECETVNHKMVLKGSLCISTLYSSVADGASIQHMEHEIPFTEVLDIEGLDENAVCHVQYEVGEVFYAVRKDDNGEPRMLALEVLLGAHIVASRCMDVEMLEDCYCPFAKTDISRETVRLDELISEGESRMTVKEIIAAEQTQPSVDAVYHMHTKPLISEQFVKDGTMVVRGNLVVFLLYMSGASEIPVQSLVTEFPFEHSLPIGDDCGGEMLTSDVSVLSESFSLNTAGEVEIRCNLEFYTKVTCPYELSVICECEQGEEEAKGCRAPLVLYFVQPGDTLWEIAKRYHTTYGKIMAANGLDHDMIMPGQKLLIPRA